MSDRAAREIERLLELRYGERLAIDPATAGLDALARMAGRGSRRAFQPRPVEPSLVRLLCATALSSPTKSDLQQRDIVIVADPDLRREIDALIAGQDWARAAPNLLIFCGNNRRQRQLHEWRGRPFANDHLDAFFNAAADAAISLSAFVVAAETVGLGCCPISAVRNRAQALSGLLGLPDHVFPVAGLALGWPAEDAPTVSPRLPLDVTVHVDRFDEEGARARVEAYDRARAAVQPYARQRYADEFGETDDYGWSEDKARQYARPERGEFGAFVRDKGFDLS